MQISLIYFCSAVSKSFPIFILAEAMLNVVHLSGRSRISQTEDFQLTKAGAGNYFQENGMKIKEIGSRRGAHAPSLDPPLHVLLSFCFKKLD